MKNLFVVVQEDGEYSDYSMTALCWFGMEFEAEAEARRLSDLIRSKDPWNDMDSQYYDGPRYSVVSLPHGSDFAGKTLV